MRIICQVYRSPRKQEMYLYVDKQKGLDSIPESLLAGFGVPQEVMVLVLTEDKKLARANTAQVMDEICRNGYYLQMPPTYAQLLHRDGNER